MQHDLAMMERSNPLESAQDRDRRTLPKRFYQNVSVAAEDDTHLILLDGRPVRTPGRKLVAVAARPIAEAVAAEWRAQRDIIDRGNMPLTRIVNSAIDSVAPRIEEVRNEVAAYAGTDLLCYRATGPVGLVERQEVLWSPVIAWADEFLEARLARGEGVVPVTQPVEALDKIAAAVRSFEPLPLAALHLVTKLTGSAILALSVAYHRLSASSAWQAANVDEDWQIKQWGEDGDARSRREMRWSEMVAAALILATLDRPTSPSEL